jgi:hypothetical protein
MSKKQSFIANTVILYSNTLLNVLSRETYFEGKETTLNEAHNLQRWATFSL